MRARPGVTLVELMIALAMLGLGLLVLAAGAATLVRHGARAALDVRAAALARDRVERLVAAGCGAPVVGDSLAGPLRARWWAATDSGLRLVRVELATTTGEPRRWAFATRLLCVED